jgi:hypothetical protein
MKLKSQELIKIATIIPKVETAVDNERSKLRTGRVYFPDFVQSFEVCKSSLFDISLLIISSSMSPLGLVDFLPLDQFQFTSPVKNCLMAASHPLIIFSLNIKIKS